MLIDQVMPQWDFGEVHATYVASNAERSLRAAREVTPREIRLLRPLWAIRVLPALLLGGRSFRFERDRPLWDSARRGGFTEVAEAADAFVLGHIGQHWRPGGGEGPRFDDVEAFVGFSRPGFCKVAVEVRTVPHHDGVLLTTETRVAATDGDARARFRRYWILIRPFSGLIRRGWLRAARRRAEV